MYSKSGKPLKFLSHKLTIVTDNGSADPKGNNILGVMHGLKLHISYSVKDPIQDSEAVIYNEHQGLGGAPPCYLL